MKNILARLLTVLLGVIPSPILSPVAFAQFEDFDAVEIKTYKITDTIYMLEGMGGNIGVSIGDDGIFIVDDQFAPLHDKISAALKELSDKPVTFVVNTHWHFDHSDGNVLFGKKGATIVSHNNSRDRMLSEQIIKAFNYTQAPYSLPGIPKITYDDAMWFHYNGDSVQLFHSGAAHTDGDTVVYFEKANVFHTGDTFVTTGLPFIDAPNGGSINGIIDTASVVIEKANDSTVIIPGHGALAKKSDLVKYRNMLITIRDRVAAKKKAGVQLDNIDVEAILEGFPKGFLPPDAFVAVVYHEV